MATAPKIPVPDKKTRTRSPAYPFINLETAIRRAKEFYDQQQHHAAPVKVAAKLWGYEEKSSGGLQTTAALVSFGLLSDVGTGFHRRVSLTPIALKILLNPDANDKGQAIKQAALTPKIHGQIWKKWGASPPEATLRYALLTEWEPRFNPNAVDAFIKEYRDTIAFAKLSESDTVIPEVKDNGDSIDETPYVAQIGDWVQWERSNGDLGFPEPKRVKGISPDGNWVYVDGQNGCVPRAELLRESPPEVAPKPNVPPPQFQSPPKTGMQEMIVPLANGTTKAVFQWPTSLSKEDVEDLRDSLKMLERKITRPTAGADTSEQA
ncbi:MAG: hypothetical protein ACLQLC_04240 [Candidatus Sulfotelmatobacter sp.]